MQKLTATGGLTLLARKSTGSAENRFPPTNHARLPLRRPSSGARASTAAPAAGRPQVADITLGRAKPRKTQPNVPNIIRTFAYLGDAEVRYGAPRDVDILNRRGRIGQTARGVLTERCAKT